MKCVAQWSRQFGVLNDTVERVPNEEAQAKVKTGDFIYVPKHVWKGVKR